MKKSLLRAERSFVFLLALCNILFVLVCVIASLLLHASYGVISTDSSVKRMSAPSADEQSEKYGTKYVKITGSSVIIYDDSSEDSADYISVEKGSKYKCLEEKTDPFGEVWYKFQYSSEKTGWVNQNSAAILYTPPKGKESCREYVAEVGKKYGAVGVQVAVIHRGMVGETYEYGYATKSSAPMTSDNKIRAASVTKVAVGMTAMKMREEGIIDLDQDISYYWDSRIYKTITLRQLLTHTSCLKDIPFCRTKSETLAQLKDPASYRKYNDWLYNNFGIGVAGTTLELAADRTVNSYAKEKFFDPLGMDASFNSGEIKNKSLISTLYNPDDSVAREASVSARFSKRSIGRSSAFFAGGLTISAKDLAKLTAILANDGTYEGVRYLSEESVQLMEMPFCTAVSRGHEFEQCMPLRYQTDIYGQDRMYYHLGIAYGTLSLISYNPDTRDGVVIITTGANESHDSRGIFKICADIADYIYNN